MDKKIRLCCPNCSQFYHFKSFSPQPKGNIPLYLTCGHSMCENCIKNIVKFGEPIECKICHIDMEIDPTDLLKLNQNQVKLYKLFPINNYMLGEMLVQVMENNELNKVDTEHYIDLKSIIASTDSTKGECFECHKPTIKMCLQCASVICDSCFNKSHKNFIVFKSHVLQDIDSSMLPNTCKVHTEKELSYYCHDCSKAICMDCMLVGGPKSCKNHNVESLQDVNESFIEELSEITPKVDETYRRLTKTAVDIGNILHNIANDTGSSSELTQMLGIIEQHFSKLLSIIQKHKKDITDIIDQLKQTEKQSLLQAKENVANTLTQARKVLNLVKTSIDQENMKKINLCSLLEEAKNVIESPWYLSNEENKDTLKLVVNDDLCGLINDYIHLEGNARSSYTLKCTSELSDIEIPPAPTAAVHPPELPKDVHQLPSKPKQEKERPRSPMFLKQISKYNYETGPMTSLDSLECQVEYVRQLPSKPKQEKEPAKPAMFLKQIPKYHVKMGSMTSLDSLESNHSSQQGAKPHYASYYKPAVHQVMPFVETKPPKQLIEGSQEVIYISHIVDPHNFFAQRACHQELVKEMLRDFRNAGSLPKPSSNHVTEGKLYLAFNKADNMWQRCRVVSIDRKDINKHMYTVFCIDFGSTEVVPIDKLRLLPPARVQTPFPLAINCALANCVPISGAWTSDDALLIQSIIDNKQAVIHVRNLRSMPNYTVKLECDVFTYEDGASVAHALVFHERARMPDTRRTYAQMVGASEKPKLFISNNDYKYRTTEDVYITHITNPDKFYVRKQRLQSVYEKLFEEMEQEYSMSVNSGTVYLPEIGGLYAVNVESHTKETSWFRGVVVELPGRRRVRLQLCDTGNVVLVHYSALRKIHNKFTTLMALATECYLSGITPLNKKWSHTSVAFLKKFEGPVLELHVENDRNKNSIGVTLYEKSDLDNVICINQEMIKHKFAVSFGLFKFHKADPVEEQPIIKKSPPTEQKPQLKPKSKLKILKKNEEIPTTSKDIDLDAKDKGPLRLEAKVLYCKSPSLLYVSFISLQKTCNELYEKIQKYYSKKAPEGKKDWKVGDRCVTKCRSSKTWRRADIIELNENDAKVFYSDFAVIENVPMIDLMELAPEFTTIGYAAVKCHLSGIMPAVGEKWPCLTIELLNELLEAYKRVFVTKCGNFKDQSMPIELWVYHTIQGGALEPDKSEWRCLNKKIVEEGLAIPDKCQQTTGDRPLNENTEDEILSFLNIHKSLQELLQLDSIPKKPEQEPSDPDTGSQTPDCDETTAFEKYTNTVLISDWLPPEPFKSEEFTAMPTYIDNDGVIYLYDISQQDTQDLIRKALDVRFKKPDPKCKSVKWTVGEPCIAMFFLDSKFYRGRVLGVNEETKSCLIHYIDYGNEEQCDFTDLRKSIALYQIPTQAHKCVLDGIKPADGHWDRQTLDYIHKSIVEKQCLVKVKGPAVDGVIPVDLKFDKLWINEHLVDFEMATYNDGSKAVVPKFAPTVNNELSAIESDSGPEYIIEDDSDTIGPKSTSQDSFDMKYFEGKDWNDIIDEDLKKQNGNYITFQEHLEPSFVATVNIINSINTLELNKINDDVTAKEYDKLFATLQEEAENQPPLNGIFENKACLALFSEDSQWYRASILEYSEAKNRIKVRYVDYGNIEVIHLSDAREIKEAWAKLPPATISACIDSVKVNKDIEMKLIVKKYTETFLEKEAFLVEVIRVDNKVPYVELRDISGKLVYQHLLDEGIFLRSDPLDSTDFIV